MFQRLVYPPFKNITRYCYSIGSYGDLRIINPVFGLISVVSNQVGVRRSQHSKPDRMQCCSTELHRLIE